jgi:hypothetical protein
MEQSNTLLQAVMLVTSTHGGSPTIVLGDFHFSKSDSTALQRALEFSTWSDALVSFAHLPNADSRIHGTAPTHFPTYGSPASKSGGSRIDHILLINAAKRLASDAQVSPKRIPGGHVPLFLQLDVSTISFTGWFWNCPQAFDVHPYPELADADFLQRENEARTAANSNNEEVNFHAAPRRLDTQSAWDILNTLIDKFLQHRMGQVRFPPKGNFKTSAHQYDLLPWPLRPSVAELRARRRRPLPLLERCASFTPFVSSFP